MFFLFIAIAKLQNFENFNSPINMLDVDSVASDLGVKPLLIIRQLAHSLAFYKGANCLNDKALNLDNLCHLQAKYPLKNDIRFF